MSGNPREIAQRLAACKAEPARRRCNTQLTPDCGAQPGWGTFCCKEQAQMGGRIQVSTCSTKDLACSVVQIHPPRLNCLAKPTDRCSPTEESGTFEETEGETEIEDEFSQEVQEGCEIRRTYGIPLDSARYVVYFRRRRSFLFQPLTHLGCKTLPSSVVV
jgi:hypothetical protein